jgi:Spy/CpxP family protein refolding chaperone
MSHIIFGTALLLLAGVLAAKRRHFYRLHGTRRLLRSLDASPAQERALRDLIHTAREQLRDVHHDARGLRQELGEVLGAPTLDDSRMAAAEAKVAEKVRDAGDILRKTVVQMHEILDARQREQLADWITSGRHCYKCAHC